VEGYFSELDKLAQEVLFLLLAYKTSIHQITGMMPSSMVFRREWWLTCDILFKASVCKEWSTSDYLVVFVDWPVTGWRSTKTIWPVTWDSRKKCKSGCES
jgi:hypothetical protein